MSSMTKNYCICQYPKLIHAPAFLQLAQYKCYFPHNLKRSCVMIFGVLLLNFGYRNALHQLLLCKMNSVFFFPHQRLSGCYSLVLGLRIIPILPLQQRFSRKDELQYTLTGFMNLYYNRRAFLPAKLDFSVIFLSTSFLKGIL